MSGPPQPSMLVARLSTARPGQPSGQQEVLEEIRRVVLAGEAPPGTPIPLEAVAQFFDVSPIPVRESLKTLIAEGLVDHEPRGGYRVAQLTREELREFYVIREVLETAALRSAVERATRSMSSRARRSRRTTACSRTSLSRPPARHTNLAGSSRAATWTPSARAAAEHPRAPVSRPRRWPGPPRRRPALARRRARPGSAAAHCDHPGRSARRAPG